MYVIIRLYSYHNLNTVVISSAKVNRKTNFDYAQNLKIWYLLQKVRMRNTPPGDESAKRSKISENRSIRLIPKPIILQY